MGTCNCEFPSKYKIFVFGSICLTEQSLHSLERISISNNTKLNLWHSSSSFLCLSPFPLPISQLYHLKKEAKDKKKKEVLQKSFRHLWVRLYFICLSCIHSEILNILKIVWVQYHTLKHNKRQKRWSLWDLCIMSKCTKLQVWCGRCCTGTVEDETKSCALCVGSPRWLHEAGMSWAPVEASVAI